MQRKSEQLETISGRSPDLAEFMLSGYSTELKKLLARDKYSGREPRNSGQFDDTIVKLFQEAFEIDIKTCTEDEWTERISSKGGALKQWQSLIKGREAKEIENSRKGSLLFIALSVLLLIGIGLLPKSPVPVSVPGATVTSVSVPASVSPTTQLSTVKATLTAKKL